MALTSTVFRFDIEVSDVDRGVYTQLELRPALHPSETLRYLLTRVLAYCLCYEEGITFSRGLAFADEPALWVKDLQGNTQAWIEVGTPSPERLHKAAKAVSRMLVFVHHDIEQWKKTLRGKHIHRAEAIEAYAVEAAFLDVLEPLAERSNRWTLSRSDGDIYLTIGDQTITTRLTPHALVEAAQ